MESSSSTKIKWGVVSLVAFLFLAFAAWAIIASKSKPAAPVKLSNSGNMVGTSSAKLTMVEFGDFQCPACKAYESATEQVRKNYKNDINFVFKHFPLKNAHPNAMAAAIAAQAAARQGKFWEYHDLLYQKQEEWAPLQDPADKFVPYAKDLSLDTDKFKKDMSDESIQAAIDAQESEGIAAGVDATPTFYLNNVKMNVTPDYNSFKKIIDQALSVK